MSKILIDLVEYSVLTDYKSIIINSIKKNNENLD